MIRLTDGKPARGRETVLTIGKFESVHLGHKRLLERVVEIAGRHNMASAAVTFNPHPLTWLGDPSYKPLFGPDERASVIERTGIDYLLELTFDSNFAELSPSEFCGLLFEKINAKKIVVGESFRFGKNREGNFETLKTAAHTRGAEIIMVAHELNYGKKISTSSIRRLLDLRKPEEAAAILGFPFFLCGNVKSGNRIGRTLGFPTANIEYEKNRYVPPDGVYATRTIIAGQRYTSATNVGMRPTIVKTSAGERTVESFINGYEGQLYGERITTEFIAFLRREEKFSDVNSLMAQIARDIKTISEGNDRNG